jgi:thiol-disulfide isomerase/thioredoxin
MERLTKLAEKLAREKAGSDVAAYAAFRELTSEYSLAVNSPGISAPAMMKAQNLHMERLAKFVAAYPKADDGADALIQLGMISEFQGKKDDAKKWYEHLARQYPNATQALKATGALRRMNLVGKPWELNAQAANLGGSVLSLDKLRGKVTVVYYWATWCDSAKTDFQRLKQLAATYKSQLEVVAINVDDQQAEAEAFIRANAPVGYQLFAAGGLESPLAVHYGMIIFPNIILVGRDGKVLSADLDMGALEDEVKKATK